MINYAIMSSPIGKLLLAKSTRGLNHIIFEYKIQQYETIIGNAFPDQKIINNDDVLKTEVNQLNEYFYGKRKNFDIKLDIEMPPFYQKVLNIVNKIPYGRYLSYQEVASKAGNPKATRAAGSANSRNPIPVIIPCHREYWSRQAGENFDNFVQLLFGFLKENKTSIEEINNIFINQGPGKFSSIRISVSIVKALSVTNKINLYGFKSNQVKNCDYNKIIDLFNKELLTKNLIKPQYLS